MTDVVIHGFGPSTYTWTVRLACAEKGITHELREVEFGSHALKALHPFSRIPILEHGDFRVYESMACARYVDEAFDGPALQPTDPKQRARMEQFSSVLNDYGYGPLVRTIVIHRLVRPNRGEEPDEAAIKDAMPEVENLLGVLEGALSEADYLAGGDAPSIADLHFTPCIFWFDKTPEGEATLPRFPTVQAWLQRMTSRPSFAATAPAPPQEEAAE